MCELTKCSFSFHALDKRRHFLFFFLRDNFLLTQAGHIYVCLVGGGLFTRRYRMMSKEKNLIQTGLQVAQNRHYRRVVFT